MLLINVTSFCDPNTILWKYSDFPVYEDFEDLQTVSFPEIQQQQLTEDNNHELENKKNNTKKSYVENEEKNNSEITLSEFNVR